MPQRNDCTFNSYEFSEREILEASLLNPLQRQLIQTDRARIAENILTLKFDPLNPNDFIQQDSYLKGQLEILQYLLLRAEESEVQIQRMASNSL